MASPAAPAGSRQIRLQVVRVPSREKHILNDVSTSLDIRSFQSLLEHKFGLAASLQALFVAGIPPRPIDTDVATATLAELGIRSGDSIELRTVTSDDSPAVELQQGTGVWDVIGTISATSGRFRRREMPADNSCLFHAIAYLCANKQTGAAAAHNMRELAANIVASDPDKYTTAVLGSPNALYQEHILNPNTWGGAIELAIFAEHFRTEIIAFDPKALREDVFGQGADFTSRCWLIYTGDHYDGLVFTSSESSTTEQVLFSTKDDNAWARARGLIESLHSELVAQGRATRTTEWRHNKDVHRTNAASKRADEERAKRVAAEKAKISVSSATDITPVGSFTETSSVPATTSTTTATTSPSTPSSPPASAAATTASTTEWTCSRCTCVNALSRRSCAACHSPNPSHVSAASSTPVGTSFNCDTCTAWNERPSSTCAVCGTRQAGATDAGNASTEVDEDGVRAPLPQRQDQLIGGDDDLMPTDALLPVLTSQQRAVLAQPWDCPRCTMHNGPSVVTCTACHSYHPSPLLNPTTAAAAAAAAAPTPSFTERVKDMFKAAPPWICERCGKSQSAQLYCCGNCRLPNAGLQTRLAQQPQDCSIM